MTWGTWPSSTRALIVVVAFVALLAGGLAAMTLSGVAPGRGSAPTGQGSAPIGPGSAPIGPGSQSAGPGSQSGGPGLPGPASSTRPAATATPRPLTACTNASAVAGWSLARQASQVVMLSAPTDDVASDTALIGSGVGGVLLTGASAPPGLVAALAALHAAGGQVPPLVAVDEEGGRVQRLPGLVGSLVSSRDQAASLSPRQVQDEAAALARRLKAVGVDMDLAPDADIDGGAADRPIGDRSFSADPERAAAYAGAFARGLELGGVIPVVKHFPGHGHADGDTDEQPATTPPLDRMRGADLRPFAALVAAGVPAVMVGHLQVPGLTEAGRPASVSPAAIGLLRHQLGFTGLVMTDSLSMGAISRTGMSVPQAAVQALVAGADVVLFTSNGDAPPTVGAITAAVASGTLAPARLQEAVGRILAVKHVDLCAGGSAARSVPAGGSGGRRP